MISHHFRPGFLRILLVLVCVIFSSCRQERIVLVEPKENDLITINGCVISACNYLALVSAKHKLESNFWSKILLVRYENHPAGHAYCVWETEGTIYGYDRNSGGFPIPVYTRDPRAIAIVLAQELSKILEQPLAVRSAEFVEPGQVDIYKYSIKSEPKPNPSLATTAPFRVGNLALGVTRQSAAPNEQ
ncbi:MAG: hypothetical protein M3128_01915 [Verrucomicrobiota bacterium]|nr:hypothetical protein [Verrucomicrobiota bacterium]